MARYIINIPQEAYLSLQGRKDLNVAEMIIANGKPIIRGKWMRCDDSTSNQKCNICGNYKVNQLETNYCGKCGAKMKESEEEE